MAFPDLWCACSGAPSRSAFRRLFDLSNLLSFCDITCLSAGESSGDVLVLLDREVAGGAIPGAAAAAAAVVDVVVVAKGFLLLSADGIPFPNESRNGELGFEDESPSPLLSGRDAANDDCERSSGLEWGRVCFSEDDEGTVRFVADDEGALELPTFNWSVWF